MAECVTKLIYSQVQTSNWRADKWSHYTPVPAL